VADRDHDRVVGAVLQLVRRERRQVVLVQRFLAVHPGSCTSTSMRTGAARRRCRPPRVAQVRAVLLERQAEHQHARADRVDPPLRHQAQHFAGDIAAHAVVDAPAGQDHLRVVAELLRLVRQVVGIHADAVAADQAGRNGRKFHLVPAASSTSSVSMPIG
jgi:hypothetical protein